MRGRSGRPPGWILLLLTGFAMAGVVWSSTYPGAHLGYLVWIVGALAWLALVWGIRTGRHLRRRRQVSWPMVCAAPALVLVVVGATVVCDPLALRWHYARPAFDRAAHAMLSDPNSAHVADTTIAGYAIGPAEVRDGAVYLYVRDGGLFDRYGFVYRSGTAPDSNIRLRSLGDGWYSFADPLSSRPPSPAESTDDDRRP